MGFQGQETCHKDLGEGADTTLPGTLFPKSLYGSLPAVLLCLSVPGLECEPWGAPSRAQGPGTFPASSWGVRAPQGEGMEAASCKVRTRGKDCRHDL